MLAHLQLGNENKTVLHKYETELLDRIY